MKFYQVATSSDNLVPQHRPFVIAVYKPAWFAGVMWHRHQSPNNNFHCAHTRRTHAHCM